MSNVVYNRLTIYDVRITFYYKKFNQNKPEENPKKHTLTSNELESIVNMFNSNDKTDIDLAIKILSNSNCNQTYDDIIWKLYFGGKWKKEISNDGINRWIWRDIKI